MHSIVLKSFIFFLCLLLDGVGRVDAAEVPAPTEKPVPLLHLTDLYHPHEDPDDHWDLATICALASSGALDLRGVVFDYPDPPRKSSPAIAAVAQTNTMTGLAVPCAVGVSAEEAHENFSLEKNSGIGLMPNTLRQSSEPVVIGVVGSCRNIALAARVEPELFREKCRGVYLNAGTGTTDPALGANSEYNTRLDVESYRAVFDLPCPIYWAPCFETLVKGELRVETHGTYWSFNQAEILPQLAPQVQNYFLYALSQSSDLNWLDYLHRTPDQDLLAKFGNQRRNMWCIAGFLHMAGFAVLEDGSLEEKGQTGGTGVFSFKPISLRTGPDGVEAWEEITEGADRYLFTVNNLARYPDAMTRALARLLATLE